MTRDLVTWTDAHRAVALDLIRIYVGVGLAVRGTLFLSDPGAYTSLLPGGAESPFAALALMHYVGLSHAAGGLLLALGLLTRIAALAQLPILVGAGLLVHLPADGLFSQEFAFAAFVAVVLAVLSVWGSGPWSLDEAVQRWTDREAANEAAVVEAHARELRGRPRSADRAAAARPAVAAPTEPCVCGHDRDHPSAQAVRLYAGLRRLRFLTGTHPRPSTVAYVCRDCGGLVTTVTDPEELEALRFESAG
ncbi:DoxX family membrane protein [Rubrivirga sp. IMCC45206]|uniref:DoxX family membrane protein n=1 Tax=Rubrivirga sp. IMCC45206 TaxID=3391614 RepID=UPI00398FB054